MTGSFFVGTDGRSSATLLLSDFVDSALDVVYGAKRVKICHSAYSLCFVFAFSEPKRLPQNGNHMLHPFMHITLMLMVPTVVVTALTCGESFAQTMFDCKNEAGQVKFSDRPCPEVVRSKQIVVRQEFNLKERKAENDARISRDKALANNMQASRDSEEQAGFAAQIQQVQAAKTIDGKVLQERSSQNSKTNSTVSRDPGFSQ